MLKKINEAAEFLAQQFGNDAKIVIVLGSGLNHLADEIITQKVINYTDIPHFPVTTVEGHEGKLIYGKLCNIPIIAMQGRFHYYEGYDMKQVTFPVRVFKAMGVQTMVLSNAAGGMNPLYKVGDIVMITDHINFFPENPLRGKNDNQLGERFPDMSEVYTHALLQKAGSIAKSLGIPYHKGVYVGTSGPTFETPAEYRMYRILGGDCVGMSTVPEAIVAHHGGMQCIAFSVITDLGIAGQVEKVSHREVLNAANMAGKKLQSIVKELVKVI
ncbi:MAG: purine-nucleoside phosphorylase [Bacteroidales bacterium]|nr:purine-nucleoside phosphorylase [Bacteroidales bacterium]